MKYPISVELARIVLDHSRRTAVFAVNVVSKYASAFAAVMALAPLVAAAILAWVWDSMFPRGFGERERRQVRQALDNAAWLAKAVLLVPVEFVAEVLDNVVSLAIVVGNDPWCLSPLVPFEEPRLPEAIPIYPEAVPVQMETRLSPEDAGPILVGMDDSFDEIGRTVETLRANGVSWQSISELVDVPRSTLRRKYAAVA